MWELFKEMMAEEMYTYLERENLPEEQNGSRRGSHGSKEKLSIDKTVLRD